MPKTTFDTIEELLRGVQDDVDDSETSYKLRNARQLVHVLRQRNQNLEDAVDETVSDEQILENLRSLGYLD